MAKTISETNRFYVHAEGKRYQITEETIYQHSSSFGGGSDTQEVQKRYSTIDAEDVLKKIDDTHFLLSVFKHGDFVEIVAERE